MTVDLEREYVRRALDNLRAWLVAPDRRTLDDMRRHVDLAISVMESHGHATADELRREFGGRNWVLSRRTKAIVERYGDDVICVSPKQYDAAERRAIEARVST